MPNFVVVMGVSGCGKSSVGELSAKKLGWKFVDGDDLHPQSNRDKMAKGIPLNDEDRMPWLERIKNLEKPVVVACSALKKTYRDKLRNADGCVFVFLKASKEVLIKRMTSRSGHYMPVSLLESQLETLEEPVDEQGVLIINTDTISIEESVNQAFNYVVSM